MIYSYQIESHKLPFKRPAKTSRNVFEYRSINTVKLTDLKTGITGIGECAPLNLLSIDDKEDYLDQLNDFSKAVCEGASLAELKLQQWPSIRFGLECALLDLSSANGVFYTSRFTQSQEGIPINGLVWMNDIEQMTTEAFEKIKAGYDCIKIKVGALDFDSECRLLEQIRQEHPSDKIQLRLDANGAFKPDEAMEQLNELKRFEIHSIEQPVQPRNWDVLGKLCREAPIDIALDEELIGWPIEEAYKMLTELKPQYIILKPNLIGGLQRSDQWIAEAQRQDIDWWATSALESNIGLNFIAQWVASYSPTIAQGLGTGSLYSENFESPLELKAGRMYFNL